MTFPSIVYNVFTNNFDYAGSGGGGGSITSFKVDSADEFAYLPGDGTITPTGGVASLYGDNGIIVVQNIDDPSVGQIRFARGFANTVSDEVVLALAFETIDNTTRVIQILVAGYCLSQQQGIGGSNWVTIVNNGGIAEIVDLQDNIINCSPNLEDADFSFLVSGSQIRIYVHGSTAGPIEWTVCTPGQVSS